MADKVREILARVQIPAGGSEANKLFFYVKPDGADAVLSALSAAGFVVVPVLPTEKMLKAGRKSDWCRDKNPPPPANWHPRPIWAIGHLTNPTRIPT